MLHPFCDFIQNPKSIDTVNVAVFKGVYEYFREAPIHDPDFYGEMSVDLLNNQIWLLLLLLCCPGKS